MDGNDDNNDITRKAGQKSKDEHENGSKEKLTEEEKDNVANGDNKEKEYKNKNEKTSKKQKKIYMGIICFFC